MTILDIRARLLGPVVFAVTLLLAGCGGGGSSSNNNAQNFQAPTQASQTNTYVGTSSPGDLWKVTLNHPGNNFSATDVSVNQGTMTGLFAKAGGFLNLSQTNVPPQFQPAGFALEILGRAALVREGFGYNPLSVLVQQGDCPNISQALTFEFIALPSSLWAENTDVAYGSVTASTSGTSWTFSALNQFSLGSKAVNPGAALSQGTCGTSAAGNVVSIPSNSSITTQNTVAIGPSGFFVEDQGTGTSGMVGFIQLSSPVSTTDVVNAQYLGFIYEAGALNLGLPEAQTASFGCKPGPSCTPPSSPTALAGGEFPGDDPTQFPNIDTTIDLGKQDGSVNGLYESASITLPVPDPGTIPGTKCDPVAVTCTFPAVAIVGTAENKFALFVLGEVSPDGFNTLPMGIYLYQQ